MLKQIAYTSAIAVALLVAPTVKLFAQTQPTPSAVTGGDPQPTGRAIIGLLSIIPSLVVL